MVLTLDTYNPLMAEDDATSGSLVLALRVLTRKGEVVIDFDEFQDLLSYRDSLSTEGASGSWSLQMAVNERNERLFQRLHPGLCIEVYCARNANPLEGAIADPSQIRRTDTTPDLSVIPEPVFSESAAFDPSIPGGAGGGLVGSTTQATELTPNRRAFLDMLAYAEGTSGPDGYRTMFTGRTFDGFSDHPRIRNRGGGYTSDAAGRYQFLARTWDGLTQRYGYTDFSPETQDRAAIRLIEQRGALAAVDNGDFETAVTRVNQEWASMPGSPYGQPVKTMAELRQVYEQRLTAYQAGTEAPPQEEVSAPVEQAITQTQQTQKYSTTLAAQRYAASRGGGSRKHAGVDLDISGSAATAISFIGGICTNVDYNACGYWDYLDIWNVELGVVERISEYDVPLGVSVGDRVQPGQAVGRGEKGRTAGCSYGVFHYEIRTGGLADAAGGKKGGFGFAGTTDPVAYLRGLGIDPYAEPDKVFATARIQAGQFTGVPGAAGGGGSTANIQIPPVAIEGVVVEAVPDYYLDKCPHLLMHGIISDYGLSEDASGNVSLSVSGEGYGKIYSDSFILLDQNAPTSTAHALEARSMALVPTAVSYIYYQILRNWVENFWGSELDWEARTRIIPIPPNFMTRVNEGSVWSALQFLSVQGIFHQFVDHTGAICWEKLPWSSIEWSLIDGRNWEDLPSRDCPSWKIIDFNERLSESGTQNFVRIVPSFQGSAGGQQPFGIAGFCYNAGSIRQYGGPHKLEIQAPMGIGADQWYTSAPRRQAEATANTFQDLVVLEAIRWFDRPVILASAQVRGESGWRIGTRISITDDWNNAATTQQWYVKGRSHSIDIKSARWVTSLDLIGDRRSRHLGIGLDAGLTVPLAPDEYWAFDRNQRKVIEIGNDSIAYAFDTVVPKIGEENPVEEVKEPETDTDVRSLDDGAVEPTPAEVIDFRETENPPGGYVVQLEEGAEVPSPISGRVVRSGILDDYGQVVEVKGSDGRSWLVGHLDARAVTVGQRISQGQTIGNQGASGAAEQPYLVVQIRRTIGGRAQVVGDRDTTRPLLENFVSLISGNSGDRESSATVATVVQ